MRYERLRVENYRCLADVDLELGGLNILIGPNGSGKTSLLDVFQLLASGAKGELTKAISERGGLVEILTIDRGPEDETARGLASSRRSDYLKVRLDTRIHGKPDALVYEVELQPRGLGHLIANEVLSPFQRPGKPKPFMWITTQPGHPLYHNGQDLVPPNWDYNESELSLSQVPKTYSEAEHFRSRLASSATYGSIELGHRAPIRDPQSLEPNEFLPDASGGNLISVLYNLENEYPDVFERLIDSLKAAFPDFQEIRFPLVAAGKATMIWKSATFRRGFYPDQISDGMLRFLWLTTLLLSPTLPPVVAIDEPEISLHPQLLMLLAGLLQEASLRSQIFVATHSDRLIHWVQPSDVVVVDREDGVSTLKRADALQFDLSKWLADFSLDELWLMGQLGGRT